MSDGQPSDDMESFVTHLRSSNRILALLGAGLSAASGLPTFRGAGGMWRNMQAVSLASPDAFEDEPGLVWQFYSYRRHMALQAKPNRAHFALAELSRRNRNFVTVSQNVDGLCKRAGHAESQLHNLHGSLFDIKCSNEICDYLEKDNYVDPIVPALAIPVEHAPLPSDTKDGAAATSNLFGALSGQSAGRELDIANAEVALPKVLPADLPKCPKCGDLLRPGVVWFGEPLPTPTINTVHDWIEEGDIDLMLVIGTSAQVWPAAGYVDIAQRSGARVAVVNMDANDKGSMEMGAEDWYFCGDAGEIVPRMLQSVIGDIPAASSA